MNPERSPLESQPPAPVPGKNIEPKLEKVIVNQEVVKEADEKELSNAYATLRKAYETKTPKTPPMVDPKYAREKVGNSVDEPQSTPINKKSAEKKVNEDYKSRLGARDYYELLSVPRNASKNQIEAAYRKMAMDYHPDRNPGSEKAAEVFKRATNARNILLNSEKRYAYDKTLLDDDSGEFATIINDEFAQKKTPENTKSEKVEDAILGLREAWEECANKTIRPTSEYYNSFLGEMPGYIDAETKVVKMFPRLDEAWSHFRKETGIDVGLPKGYYDHLARNHSTLWVEWDIKKINLLVEISDLLKKKEKQMDFEHFKYLWDLPIGSIEGELEKMER